MDIITRQLTKDYLLKNVDSFIDILSDVPGEYWKKEHFLLDLPGKFEYSCCALDNNLLVGYIVASLRADDVIHIHKYMVARDYRGKSVGSQMLSFFEKSLEAGSVNMITLKVSAENEKAIRFYHRNDFKTLAGIMVNNAGMEQIMMGKNL